MKLKRVLTIILFIVIFFVLVNPAYAIIFGNREIVLNISNVDNIDNVEVYMLYPTDYVQYLYSTRLNDDEYIEFHKDKSDIVKKMKDALESKDYINLIRIDELGILELSADEKYIEHNDKAYIKARISYPYLDKENMKLTMGEEYQENTIYFSINIDYYYEGSDFKFLLVEGDNKKILSLDKLKYQESYRGVTDYSLMASADYNKIEKVCIIDKDNLEIPEAEKNLIDIIIENIVIILITFSIINLILIIVLVKIKKNKSK